MNKENINKYLSFLKVNNPYYKSVLGDINPNDYSLSDIKVLTKQDIRSNESQIITNGYSVSKLNMEKTNGTTEKVPLTLYKSTQERINLDLQLWKSRFNLSLKGPLRCAVYYYNADVLYNSKKIFDYGKRIVTYIQMNKSSDESYLEDLKYFKENNIRWLIGPISVMYKLALVSQKFNYHIDFEYIEFTSEYPTPFYRDLIESQFNCKTCIQYSCHELWGIAFTDKEDRLQIYNDTIVEVAHEANSKRGLGNAIITKLSLKAMPFLRYSISDLIKVDGNVVYNYGFRSTDKVILEKVNIPWHFFDNLFFQLFKESYLPVDLLPLVNYQVIYDDKLNNITINTLNISNEVATRIKDKLTNNINKQYGNNITIEVTSNNRFFRDILTGKMRAIIPRNIINKEIW